MTLKIGVTGGIGSGKSVVSRLFKVMGIPVYDSDQEAKRLNDSHPVIRKGLVELFGPRIYSESGLNRPLLAEKIFKDKDLLKAVNALVHPVVAQDFSYWVESNDAFPFVLKEAAILFESGAYKAVDKVICITAPEEQRIGRVMLRDGVTEEQVRARMVNQWPEEEKKSASDFVITNDGSQPLIPQVLKIMEYLNSLS